MIIRPLAVTDAPLVHDFFVRNWHHLKPWVPQQAASYKNASQCATGVTRLVEAAQRGSSIRFLLLTDDQSQLIGSCTLSQIVHGPFQACYMGYDIDAGYEGKGLMRALCQRAIAHAFGPLKLHRIMANYMPHNNRSARLLKRLGFKIEGVAQNYLEINGRWENHVLTALARHQNPANRFQ
ncbi:GNAT family N-acetyltransferase [Teredinibacter turnerae]|uniref:GNAT family N-acetyltransferase n=1 Tax=Teredinibacter turnerae TaxID=2426 RepID=UPI0003819016|nr:GNAT family N-acetyltransferase [Teredinibacter turnerae]